MLPLGDHADHWSNLLGEIVREFPMHYPSWHKIEPKKKAGVMGTLRQHFDLMPHIQSKLWPKNPEGHRAAFGQDLHRQQVILEERALGSTARTRPCGDREPLKMLKPGQVQGFMQAGILVTLCHPRYADGELRDSRVPVPDQTYFEHILLTTYLAGRGMNSILSLSMILDEHTPNADVDEVVANGSGGGGDDEPGADEDAGGDEDTDGDEGS
ncbi:hypothetical protein Tco_1113738 [Tanacetum coccineum]|uniref:Uncharacterized protein n=1 Tax=Tanacetum coccineum TaxID=301880 RepID=A0ABQ5IUL5_9ASTR